MYKFFTVVFPTRCLIGVYILYIHRLNLCMRNGLFLIQCCQETLVGIPPSVRMKTVTEVPARQEASNV